MRNLAVVAFVLGVSLALPAAADTYTVKGSVDCPDVVREDSVEAHRTANMWWILGYFTGRNFEHSMNVGRDIDSEALYTRVLSFCLNNPDKDLDDASNDLYSRLR